MGRLGIFLGRYIPLAWALRSGNSRTCDWHHCSFS
jgi:hypothetical protein